jgi:hypothetical protein
MGNCVISRHGKILSQWNLIHVCVQMYIHTHTYVLIHIHINSHASLNAGIHSEKCIIRPFRLCANVIECTYTNLDSTV